MGVIKAIWQELIAHRRDWAIVGAGVANLSAVIFVICIVAEARWKLPAAQIDVLKVLGIILALTNSVVVVSLSRVNARGRGPGGIGFEVDGRDEEAATAQVHVEGDEAVKPTGGA